MDFFGIEEVDKETRLVDLCLELSNLRQKKTKNIAEFISRVDVLFKELAGSQVDVGMAITQGKKIKFTKSGCYLSVQKQGILSSTTSRHFSR